MPQPYHGGCSWGNNTLFSRPEIAVSMANAMATWVLVEEELELLYAYIMSAWTGMRPKDGFLPTHPIAYHTFEALQTLNARLDVLREIAKAIVNPAEYSELRDKLGPAIRKRAKERNTLVHSLWGLVDEEPDAVIQATRFGYNYIYKKSDFDAMTARFFELRNSLIDYRMSIAKRVEENGWR